MCVWVGECRRLLHAKLVTNHLNNALYRYAHGAGERTHEWIESAIKCISYPCERVAELQFALIYSKTSGCLSVEQSTRKQK